MPFASNRLGFWGVESYSFTISSSLGTITWDLIVNGDLILIPSTGLEYTLTPLTPTSLNIKLWGAGGGAGGYDAGGNYAGNGGGGGFVHTFMNLSVEPYILRIGGGGGGGSSSASGSGGGAGGYNGGGTGGNAGGGGSSGAGGGGGGASGIYSNSLVPLAIAGGGGGGGGDGLSGTNSYNYGNNNYGSLTGNTWEYNGVFNVGSNGGSISGDGGGNGAGGGGYYGGGAESYGGGGDQNGVGGYWGSNYIIPSAATISNITPSLGQQISSGLSDTQYISNYGQGGSINSGSGVSGLIIITKD
jgi:hypothetical protein